MKKEERSDYLDHKIYTLRKLLKSGYIYAAKCPDQWVITELYNDNMVYYVDGDGEEIDDFDFSDEDATFHLWESEKGRAKTIINAAITEMGADGIK